MALDPSRYYIGDVGDNSTVIQGGPISVGFSAEEVLELVKTAVTGVTQLHVARIEELSTRLGITQAAVTTMLCMLGHDNVAVEQLPAALAAHAAQVLAMRTALSGALPHENSETAGLRRNALALLDAGDFVEAISQLENLCAREQTISEQRRARAEVARSEWIAALRSEVQTRVLLIHAALLQSNFPAALDQFEGGWQVLQQVPEERWKYSTNVAGIFFTFADRAGRKDVLAACVEICRRMLVDASYDRPKWALTQLNLGVALAKLGVLEGGTASLIAAEAAMGAALTELTRESATDEWAEIQLNLGNVRWTLFQREYVPLSPVLPDGVAGYCLSARLTNLILKAHTHYENALQVWTCDNAPLSWAKAKMGIGLLLVALGSTPFGDPKQIEEALDHYDEALKGLWLVKEKAQVPFRWALLQVNRGLALWKLGEKRHDPAILEAAVKAFNDALDVFIATKSDYYVNGVRQHRDRLQSELGAGRSSPLIS